MARPVKTKKVHKVSLHSRAARRETSPSLNVDKSILNAEPPTKEKAVNHASIYAGISKKKKGKPLTRQQRLRQEKGMERAEQNLDKLSKKVADSHFREKKVKTRNAAWEELNEKVMPKPAEKAQIKKDDLDVLSDDEAGVPLNDEELSDGRSEVIGEGAFKEDAALPEEDVDEVL
ncbi:hypothetical protein CAC42_2513 [Sphaceloma murrayae]|uniref:Alb1-domain-containing protein n=1 Tax=Sphaceloma murrayae TaxID=2082308 RepID=A0A2K1QWA4_9PEZI|nr:hypothetical protein CAC42_2513 [Sphaceloma murrayae]